MLALSLSSDVSADGLRMLKVEDVALRLGWSLRTLERRCASGNGPTITKLSARQRGVRVDHLREWLDRRAKEPEAA